MSNLGSLVVSLEANIAKFTSDMGKAAAIAEARARQIDKSIGLVKTGLASIGLGFTFGATFDTLKNKIEGAIASAAGLQQLSERTGATVEALSGLSAIAKLSGTDTETLATSLQKLSKSMVDAQNGGKKTSASFAAIGISVKDLAGKGPDQVFQMVAKALANYQDGAEKVVIAQNLLGKSGANLLPVLKDLADAGDLQVKVTAAQAQMADEYEKNQVRLKVSTEAIFRVIGMELVPVFNAFTKALLDAQNANDGVRKGVDDLAKDGSIRTWAENAARVVGVVIDAFDGVARTVLIVGKTLGVAMAQAALVAQGEFRLASNAGLELGKDIDGILNRELFSSRLEKRLQESAKTTAAAKPRARINTTGLGNGDVYKGPSDDPTRKLLEGQLKAQDALIATEKTQLQSREQVLQAFYNQEYLDASEYYATKQTLIQDALKAELEAYDKQVAAIAIYMAQAKKETDVQEGRNKLAEVAKKRAAAEVLASKQLTDAALEQARVYREFDLATTAVARQNALANEQSQFQIDLLGKNTLEVAKLTEARRLQLALEDRLYQMRNKNLPQVEMDRAVAETEAQKERALALIEKSYQRQREGAFGATQAMRKYAEDAGNTAAQVEGAMTHAFQGMEDALVEFVMTGKLSFTAFANSIVADITRIIIKQQISNALGLGGQGGGVFGGFLSSLLGGAGGGASTGAVASPVSGWGLVETTNLPPLAGGGSVERGRSYWVGERGPEIFRAPSSGTIVPNGFRPESESNPSGTTVVHVNVTPPAGASRASATQWGAEAGRQVQRALIRNT